MTTVVTVPSAKNFAAYLKAALMTQTTMPPLEPDDGKVYNTGVFREPLPEPDPLVAEPLEDDK